MKILKLTYNEILKQVKKISFKISVGLLLLITILIPILNKAFASNDSYNLYVEQDIIDCKYSLIDDAKTNYDRINNELVNVKISIMQDAIDKKVINSRYKHILYDLYIEYKQKLVIIDNMIKNVDVNYEQLLEDYNLADPMFYSDNLQQERTSLIKEIEDLEVAIENTDYAWYLKKQITSLEDITKEKPKENDSKEIKDEYERNIKILDTYKLLLEKGVHDESDFRITEQEKLIGLYYEDKNEILSEKEYNSMGNLMKYKDYKKLMSLSSLEKEEQIKKSLYAIENNIDYNKTGTREVFKSSISTNIMLLSVIVIIIAGGIVSNEFQKGTIRLLVIRPAKRWKILLSKFLAVIAIAISLAFLANTISLIVNGIVYGFSDYGISYLLYKDNKVVEASFIMEMIKESLILLIPVLFVGLGAFTLSTITNNTALSVGFSIFLLLGSSIGIIILKLIKFPFTVYTFLPYLGYSQFLDLPSLISNYMSYQIYYTFKTANIVLLVWGIIFYIISNIIFTKKDIKN